MNKENILKNISLISRKKSPTPQKHPATSFKNLNPKSFYRNPHPDSQSPLHSKRTKPLRDHSNHSLLHTEMSESILVPHNNNLLESFKLER